MFVSLSYRNLGSVTKVVIYDVDVFRCDRCVVVLFDDTHIDSSVSARFCGKLAFEF